MNEIWREKKNEILKTFKYFIESNVYFGFSGSFTKTNRMVRFFHGVCQKKRRSAKRNIPKIVIVWSIRVPFSAQFFSFCKKVPCDQKQHDNIWISMGYIYFVYIRSFDYEFVYQTFFFHYLKRNFELWVRHLQKKMSIIEDSWFTLFFIFQR